MENDYVLSCCSTADMPAEFFEKRNIELICFHFTMDGVTYDDDLGKSIPYQEFFKRIADGAKPTTSQVNVQEYEDFWEPFLKEGKDILHVSLSSGISGTYNSASIAAKELREKFPERKLFVVDSLGASSGYGLFMDLLADRRDAGMPVEELASYAEKEKLTVNHWFFSSDLTSYFRGGRINRANFFLGTVFKICPLMDMDDLGRLIPRFKIRTKRKAMEEVVKIMEERAENGREYDGKCFISESACAEDAKLVASLIEARFPKLAGKVKINSIGTVIGSHTGPGTIALFYTGLRRTR